MTEDTIKLLWQYEQGKLRGQEIIDLFHALFVTGDIWKVHNLEHPRHYLDQAAQLFNDGMFNHGRGE